MKRLILAVFFFGGSLWADGGAVEFHGVAGPYEITLFGEPNPLRVGNADLSVLVKKTAGDSTVLDADVKLHLVKAAGGGIVEVTAPATHAKATNKLLYAAHVRLPSNGTWRVDVMVKQAASIEDLSGHIFVLEPRPPWFNYWPYFAVLPLLALLFAFNQRLKRQRLQTKPKAGRRRALP
jgi:YtkA-like